MRLSPLSISTGLLAAPGAVHCWRRCDEPAFAVSRELPRKEVIQPQVPLRLPCYDFTPITGQTLGGSLPCGLGYRLLVPPAFVV